MKKVNTFTSYNLQPEILQSLQVLHYEEATEIQQQVLPVALEGRDLAARSKTGSGKTAAFAIPICQKVQWDENRPQALVLEPTRELTVQVKEEIFHIGRNKRLKVPDVFGGFPIDKQILTLKQKSHIVVGTPGRLLDHIDRETIDLSAVETLVIDEADLMLDMGFIQDVEKIIQDLPKCQIMLFSATLDESLQDLMDRYMTDPAVIAIEEDVATVDAIRQGIIRVSSKSHGDGVNTVSSHSRNTDVQKNRNESDEEALEHEISRQKYKALLHTLMHENPDSCIIFCGTREMADVLCRKLGRDGVRCGVLHGAIDQQDRLRTIDGFRLGRFRYLIATDVAARGIDFPNLSLVFNYDFPTGKETYVHRIGRTGRNGEAGRAISLMTDKDVHMYNAIEEYLNITIPIEKLPEVTEQERKTFNNRQKEKVQLKKRKGAEFKQTITKLTISGGKKSKMRAGDIVGAICSVDGVTADDIGVIDVRDSITYVDVMNGKGHKVHDALQDRTIKGKVRKVKISRSNKI